MHSPGIAGYLLGKSRRLALHWYLGTECHEHDLLVGVHIGKVMVDTTDCPQQQHTNNCLGPKKAPTPQNGQVSPVKLAPLRMQPTLYFRRDRSYIITGGLGGFGMAIFEFLVAFGADNIVITSKRGVRSGNQQIALQTMYNQKKNVSQMLTQLFNQTTVPTKEFL